MSKIAVIQIRGAVKLSKKIKSTLEMLNLKKKNSCIIVEANNVNIGMVNVVKDYVTWGEINEQVIKELLLKRGKIVGNKLLDEDYLLPAMKTLGDVELKLATDEYFLLGDNRIASLDSRAFGPINRKLIIGKTLLRGWPLERMGLVTNKLEYN